MKKVRVLFVCMGNICRSPAAEAVLKKISKSSKGAVASKSDSRDLDIEIDSAGTEGYHVGNRPDSRMRAAAENREIPMDSFARQVMREDLIDGRFDLVIAADQENLRRLREIAGGGLGSQVRLFSEFLDDSWPDEVPDPYYGGDDGFEFVLDMLEAGCPAILDALRTVQSSDTKQ